MTDRHSARVVFISIACAVLLSTTALETSAASSQDDASPRLTLSLPNTQILSTESAVGTVDVFNSTTHELGYNPLEVVFVIRDADGRTHEQNMVTTIGHIPITTWIAPGKHQHFNVTLPGCDVLIDPCTMHAAVSVRLELKPSGFAPAVTNELAYSFVADPTATYRVTGLRDDRPLFFSRGEAQGVVPQDRAWLGFRFSGPIPTDLNHFINDDAKRQDLVEVEQGSDGALQFFTLISNEEQSQPADLTAPSKATLNAIIADVEKRYGSSVSSEPVGFVPDHPFGFDPVFSASRDAARADAARLALFVAADTVSDAFGLSDDGPQIRMMQREERYDSPPPFIPYLAYVFDRAELDREKGPFPGFLDVQIRTATGFVGLHATTGTSLISPGEANRQLYLGDGLDELTPPPVRATIAADHPEVFAIGAVARDDAARAGRDPDALAISLAAERARALASQLGESTRFLSLVVHYDDVASSSNQTLASDGVAFTVDDESHADWHRIVTPTPTPSPRIAQAASSMIVQMTAPPRTSAPPPAPVPRIFPSPTPGGVAQTPAPDLVPIDVADPQDLMTIADTVTSSPLANEYRISVAFYRGTRTPANLLQSELPDPDAVRRMVQALPGVADVAIQSSGGEMFPIGYQFVAHTIDLGRVASAVNALQSQYARLNPETKYDAAVVSSNCAALTLQAQGRSAEAAERDAVARAKTNGVELRRLVLAAVYPPESGNFCLTNAQPDALDLAGDDSLHPPSTKTLTLRVLVKLTFRTRPILATNAQ